MSTIDPFDPGVPEVRWMNKARLCADEVGLAEKTQLQSIRDPARYWKDKYRLEQQIMDLLQRHLPPAERFPVSPLVSPSPPSDIELSMLQNQDRTSMRSLPRGMSVSSHPNTPTLSPRSVYVQLSSEREWHVMRSKLKAPCVQKDSISRRSKDGKQWRRTAGSLSGSDDSQSMLSQWERSNPQPGPNASTTTPKSGNKRKRPASVESPRAPKMLKGTVDSPEQERYDPLQTTESEAPNRRSGQVDTTQPRTPRLCRTTASQARLHDDLGPPYQQSGEQTGVVLEANLVEPKFTQQPTRVREEAAEGHCNTRVDALCNVSSDMIRPQPLRRSSERTRCIESRFMHQRRLHSIEL